VPSDQRFDSTEAIDVSLLRSLMKEHKDAGRTPLIVIAFAGTCMSGTVFESVS